MNLRFLTLSQGFFIVIATKERYNVHMDVTTEQVKKVPNPAGIGGFKDHPELRNNGGRYPRAESFTYWFNFFKGLKVKDFNEWEKFNSEETRSVASDLVYTRIKNAKENLKDFQEVANRSEGKPRESTEHSGTVGLLTYEEALTLIKENRHIASGAEVIDFMYKVAKGKILPKDNQTTAKED